MFKIIGVFLIIFSCVILFMRKDFSNYYSLKFLEDIKYILTQIQITQNLDYTYIKIFNEMDLSKTEYFKKFKFNKKEEFLILKYKNKLLETKYIKILDNFLNRIGKYDKENEKEFINSSLKLVEYYIIKCEKAYKEEKRVNSAIGISIGLIISIIII